ncbi:MAG TPA: type IV toxin-antitoxin system AbiEi family antitoxin domain-containing protein [Acidimicrobiales bacterium]
MDSFDQLARRQWSLLTTEQLHALGWSDDQIWRACRSGRLVVVRRGVYRPVGAPVSTETMWMAAVLAAKGDAVLSHATAAAALGVRGFWGGDAIDLLHTGIRPPRLEGVRGHTTISLPESHRSVHARLPITSPERTLVDACALVPDRHLRRATDDLIRRRLVTTPRLVRTFEEVPVSGRRARHPMAEVLTRLVPGYRPGESVAEDDVMDTLRESGRPLPVQQFKVVVEGHRYRLDFAWPDLLEAMEWDGFGSHGGPGPFHSDRERTRRLQRAGWRLWPITSQTASGEVLATIDYFVVNPRHHAFVRREEVSGRQAVA